MRQTDARLKCCICVTVNMGVYLYRSPDSITLVDSARNKKTEWDGWEHFHASLEPREMLLLAVNLGLPLAFKRGKPEDLSLELWNLMCHVADDRRSAADRVAARDPISGKVKGKRGRKKQNLNGRVYTVIDVCDQPMNKKQMLDDCPCTTRQAKKIYEFFVDEILKTGSPHVTEGRMKDIVNDRAEELRTKQDPWRIFCYYRPELVDCQLVRLEK